MNITTVDENAPTELWYFTCTSFICRIMPSLPLIIFLFPPPSILPLSLSFFFVCVCSPLRPGCLGSHLEIIRIWVAPALLARLFSATGWLLDWLTASITEWLSKWLDNYVTGWVADWLADWLTQLMASHEPEANQCFNKRWCFWWIKHPFQLWLQSLGSYFHYFGHYFYWFW